MCFESDAIPSGILLACSSAASAALSASPAPYLDAKSGSITSRRPRRITSGRIASTPGPEQAQAAQRTAAASKPAAAQSEALRDFGLGAQVLADLGCRKIRLMSNSDRRIVGIEGFGIDVVERVPFPSSARGEVGRLVPLSPRGVRADEGG